MCPSRHEKGSKKGTALLELNMRVEIYLLTNPMFQLMIPPYSS